MFSDVEARVLERIAAAPVLPEPFPHCVIDEVFPEQFYEAIIDYWPQEESWQPLSETGRVSPGAYSARQVVLMDPDGFASLDEGRRAFWAQQVASWLLAPEFRARVMAKFALKQADAAGDALIVSDRSTYAIGPHRAGRTIASSFSGG